MGKVRVLRSSKLYSGAISLRKDRFVLEGRTVEKEIVEHQDSVGIVPALDAKTLLLVTQYRRAAGKVLLEIPAGKIEQGESPAVAARREMAEEIGYVGRLRPLMKWYLAPGYDTEFMHVYVATDLKHIAMGRLDDDENISVRKMGLDACLRKCWSGEIQDCKTVAALFSYHSRVKNNSH